MTSPQDYLQRRAADRKPTWQTYLGITRLLLLIVVALAGGIIRAAGGQRPADGALVQTPRAPVRRVAAWPPPVPILECSSGLC
jgi:hypothetical protein